MASIKQSLSQLSKSKKALRAECRRLFRVLLRRLPYVLSLVSAAPRTKRNTRSSIRFEIGGNMTRSVILALPNVHFNGISLRSIIVSGGVICIVIVTIVTSTTPVADKIVIKPFEKGQPFQMDVVITPFRASNLLDQACIKLADDISSRFAEKLQMEKPSSAVIWKPQQLSERFTQDTKSSQMVEDFAAERQADVVFYGEIECDHSYAVVRTQVYVSHAFYAGLPEIEGFYSFDDMAEPLKLNLSNEGFEQTARNMADKATALINIGHGFRLIATDVDSNLKLASDLFMQLAHTGGIKDRHGLALLWYAIGKAQLTGLEDQCNIIAQDRLNEAEASLFKALQHEPEFALAHANLGLISTYKASLLPKEQSDGIHALLDNSLARYQRAKSARVQPVNGMAYAIAILGEAQTRISMHDLNPDSADSKSMLQMAMAGLNEIVKNDAGGAASKHAQAILARAYALLGDVQHVQSNDDRALYLYNTATLLTEDHHIKTAVHLSMAELYTVRGDACLAAQHYQHATQFACDADKRALALQAQQMQFFCQQTNDTQVR